MNVESVRVDQIVVGDRLRSLSDDAVASLVESIQERGLLQPITVRQLGAGFELVFGRHRLEAAKRLGWREIPALVRDLDGVDRRLAEIDENLIRHELTQAERSKHTAERKRLYLQKHPETKQGGAPGLPGGGKAKNAPVASFAADTARKTGRSVRSVQQDGKIGEGISNDLWAAVQSSAIADSRADLVALARLPDAAQHEIFDNVDPTSKFEIRDAINLHQSTVSAPARQGEVFETELGTTATPSQPISHAWSASQSRRPPTHRRRVNTNTDGEEVIQIAATVEAFAEAIAALFTSGQKRELVELIEDDLRKIAFRQAAIA